MSPMTTRRRSPRTWHSTLVNMARQAHSLNPAPAHSYTSYTSYTTLLQIILWDEDYLDPHPDKILHHLDPREGYAWCLGHLLTWTAEGFRVLEAGTWREVLREDRRLEGAEFRALRSSQLRQCGFCESETGKIIAVQKPDGTWCPDCTITEQALTRQARHPFQDWVPISASVSMQYHPEGGMDEVVYAHFSVTLEVSTPAGTVSHRIPGVHLSREYHLDKKEEALGSIWLAWFPDGGGVYGQGIDVTFAVRW